MTKETNKVVWDDEYQVSRGVVMYAGGDEAEIIEHAGTLDGRTFRSFEFRPIKNPLGTEARAYYGGC